MHHNDASIQFRSIQPSVQDPIDLTFPMKTLGCPIYGLYALPDSNIKEKEAIKKHVP